MTQNLPVDMLVYKCVPDHVVSMGKVLFKEIQIQSNSDLSDSDT